jgi:protein phosphatase
MIDHAGSSVQGPVRSNNEDFIAHEIPGDDNIRSRKGSVFVVTDGVGGSDAGEIASREAAQSFIRTYYESKKRPEAAVRESVQFTNHVIFDLSHDQGGSYRKMETTLTGFVLVDGWIHIGHVGDSRLYRIRPEQNEIVQLTRDHSEVAELMRMGILTADEARRHPRRNVITRSVGSKFVAQADYRSEPLRVGDIFVVCTDGLWEPLEDADILEIVRTGSPSECCTRLTDMALERQTNDNLSVQVVKVLELEEGVSASQAGDHAGGRSLIARMLAKLGFRS